MRTVVVSVHSRWAFIPFVLAMLIATITVARAQTPPPPPPMPTLGNPTDLTAAPGEFAGEVRLRWTPAQNADQHWIYSIRTDGAEGGFQPMLGGSATSTTVSNLIVGEEYLLIVIAGKRQSDSASTTWSEWSNWAIGTPRSSGLPPAPPPMPTVNDGGQGELRWVEIEGYVFSMDAAANTFVVGVVEYEYFYGLSRANPVTVEYGALGFIENWLSPGLYIEAEGYYDPATNVLRAHEVESESYRGDDRNDRDDVDGDDIRNVDDRYDGDRDVDDRYDDDYDDDRDDDSYDDDRYDEDYDDDRDDDRDDDDDDDDRDDDRDDDDDDDDDRDDDRDDD